MKSRINHLTGKINYYSYDKLDRLTAADVEGTFYGERTDFNAIAENDIFETLSLVKKTDYIVKLDYQSNSVGVIMEEPTEIARVELKPDPKVFKHRSIQSECVL